MPAEFLAAYRAFITSPLQIAVCARESSLSGVLEKIRIFCQQPMLTDEQTLEALTYCNEAVLADVPDLFNAGWMPSRYHAKKTTLSWCVPQGYPEEPFHDQYIERCRQQCLLNQIISPKTLLSGLSGSNAKKLQKPAGFVFHLSRCGSTLVSGCLSAAASTSVLSESPVLTEVLLDSSVNESNKKKILLNLIDHQGRLYPGREQVVIKWNAWDVFRWPLIHSLYPDVPVVFLVRNPVEILASHQRMAGRHMASDPSMLQMAPVFTSSFSHESLLDLQIRVLGALMEKMLDIAAMNDVFIVDYDQLDAKKIIHIANFFDVHGVTQEQAGDRMSFNSKKPGQVFNKDGEEKRRVFSVQDAEKICINLSSAYGRLKDIANAGQRSRGHV